MTAVLLDTNVVSSMRIPERQNARFQDWIRNAGTESAYVSALTLMEIQAGVLKKLRRDPVQGKVLEAWLRTVRTDFQHRTISFDELAAVESAPLWLQRSRGFIDTLLAGTALAYQMPLVTRNTSDFADISGLTLVNPWA